MTHLALGLVVVVVVIVNASLVVDGVNLVSSTVSPTICCCFDACSPWPPC